MMPETKIYTIVSTGVDVDRGFFPNPTAHGSYLSLKRAKEEMAQLIEAEMDELDDRYNQEDRSDTYWEMYMEGYANSLFVRIEILSSQLMDGRVVP